MKQLTLIRHANAENRHNGQRDCERPLSPRGERDARRIGAILQNSGWQPELIISSHAVRAACTADIIATVIGYPIENILRNPTIYDAFIISLLNIVVSLPKAISRVALVGHNPSMSDLVNTLSDTLTDGMPTASATLIEFPDAATWKIAAHTRGTATGYTS